jgi:hypothetical protein
MIDFITYRKLHPETAVRRVRGAHTQEVSEDEFDKRLLEQENPPATDIINLFPPVIIGFNLRLKKWGM